MKFKVIYYVIAVFIIILILSGCSMSQKPTNELTVTFKNNTCSYKGSKVVSPGKISVTMVVKKLDLDAGMVALTLNEGKTIDDLKAWPANASQPLWANRIGEAERHVHPGETYTFEFNFDKGPFYLICFSGPPDVGIGQIGPFDVAK